MPVDGDEAAAAAAVAVEEAAVEPLDAVPAADEGDAAPEGEQQAQAAAATEPSAAEPSAAGNRKKAGAAAAAASRAVSLSRGRSAGLLGGKGRKGAAAGSGSIVALMGSAGPSAADVAAAGEEAAFGAADDGPGGRGRGKGSRGSAAAGVAAAAASSSAPAAPSASLFQLSDLDQLTTSSHPYLSPETATYRLAYLHHACNVGAAAASARDAGALSAADVGAGAGADDGNGGAVGAGGKPYRSVTLLLLTKHTNTAMVQGALDGLMAQYAASVVAAAAAAGPGHHTHTFSNNSRRAGDSPARGAAGEDGAGAGAAAAAAAAAGGDGGFSGAGIVLDESTRHALTLRAQAAGFGAAVPVELIAHVFVVGAVGAAGGSGAAAASSSSGAAAGAGGRAAGASGAGMRSLSQMFGGAAAGVAGADGGDSAPSGAGAGSASSAAAGAGTGGAGVGAGGGRGLQGSVPIPSLRPLFAEAVARLHYSPGNSIASLKAAHAGSQREVWRRVSYLLNEAAPAGSPRNPPLLVLATSHLPSATLFASVPALAHLPLLRLPYRREDVSLPHARWMSAALARGSAAFLFALQWWRVRLDAARYSQVPVGNLGHAETSAALAAAPFDPDTAPFAAGGGGEELALVAAAGGSTAAGLLAQLRAAEVALRDVRLSAAMADVFFARMLTFNRHALWASLSAVPDLGGAEAAAASVVPAALSAYSHTLSALPGVGGSGSVGFSGGGGGAGGEAAKGAGAVAGSSAGLAFQGAGAGDDASGAEGMPPALPDGFTSLAAMQQQPGTAAAAAGGAGVSPNPSITRPGLYRCVCVELRLEALAVAAVLGSHHLRLGSDLAGTGGDVLQAGGGGGAGGGAGDGEAVGASTALLVSSPGRTSRDGASAGGADEFASALHAASGSGGNGSGAGGVGGGSSGGGSVGHAFRTLRKLLANWMTDARGAQQQVASAAAGGGAAGAQQQAGQHEQQQGQQQGNPLARLMLSRFYAWLASPASVHRDPALHATVHGLMVRTFRCLLGVLRSHGVSVVFASFDRLIVATGRRSLHAAEGHLGFVLGKLAAQPLLAQLSLTPTAVWQTLLFVGEHNYSGIVIDGDRAAEAAAAAATQGGPGEEGGEGEEDAVEGEGEGAQADSPGRASSSSSALARRVDAAASHASAGASAAHATAAGGGGAGGAGGDIDYAWSHRLVRAACAAIASDAELAHVLLPALAAAQQQQQQHAGAVAQHAAATDAGTTAAAAAAAEEAQRDQEEEEDSPALREARYRARTLLDWKALEGRYLDQTTGALDITGRWTVAEYLHPDAAAFLNTAVGLYLLRPFKAAARRAFARLHARFDTLVLPALAAAAPFLYASLQGGSVSPGLSLSARGSGHVKGRQLQPQGAGKRRARTSSDGAASDASGRSDDGGSDTDGAASRATTASLGSHPLRRQRRRGDSDAEFVEAGAEGGSAGGEDDGEAEWHEGEGPAEGAAAAPRSPASPPLITPARGDGAASDGEDGAEGEGAAGAPQHASPGLGSGVSPSQVAPSAPAAGSAASLTVSLPDLATVLRRAMSREEEAAEAGAEAEAVRRTFGSLIRDKLLAAVSELERRHGGSGASDGLRSPGRSGGGGGGGGIVGPIDAAAVAAHFSLPSRPSMPLAEAQRELTALLRVRGSATRVAGGTGNTGSGSHSHGLPEPDGEGDAGGGQGTDGQPPVDPAAVLRIARRVASAVAFPRWHALNAPRPAAPLVAVATSLLALDPLVVPEVGSLRSTALALLGIGEFSSQASLRDPTATAVVPDLVCRSCSAVRDVDLARDAAVSVASSPHPVLVPLEGREAEEAAAEVEEEVGERMGDWRRRQRRKQRAEARKAAAGGAGSDEEEGEGEMLLSDEDEDEDEEEAQQEAGYGKRSHSHAAAAALPPLDPYLVSEMRSFYVQSALSSRGLTQRETDGALCRASHLYTHAFAWRCAACDHAYDSCDVESSLVAAAEARSLAYTLQDLACVRCGRVRCSPLRSYCECSGRYATVTPQAGLRAYLRALQGVAVAYGFPWLQDTVETMLAADGAL
jgi:hypothetical protein